MISIHKKQTQEGSQGIKLHRYTVQFVCYAPNITSVSSMVKDGKATPVRIDLDEEVKLETKVMGY